MNHDVINDSVAFPLPDSAAAAPFNFEKNSCVGQVALVNESQAQHCDPISPAMSSISESFVVERTPMMISASALLLLLLLLSAMKRRFCRRQNYMTSLTVRVSLYCR